MDIALNKYYNEVKESDYEAFTLRNPIGFDHTGIWQSDLPHTREMLLNSIKISCKESLPIEGIISLTTIVESAFTEILTAVLEKYPKKISDKLKIESSKAFEFETIIELQYYIVKKIVNDLTYKSPEDFIKDFRDLTGLDLNECKPYSAYVELKATRDIFIHNNGIANEIYQRKAKGLKRAENGSLLKCDMEYFNKSYEVCFNILEFLLEKSHEKWHSTEFINFMEDFKIYSSKKPLN